MKRKPRHVGLLVTALMLASCTESFKPDVSTETGNPPVIDSDLVALVITSDEVHVRGEAGAVTPPEGEVEVTVVRNQAVTSGPVEDDGSFDIEVQASIDDVFEVRAVQGDERSPAVIVIRGGAQVGEGDAGTLSCEQKVDLSRMVFEAAIDDADRSCTTDDDCKEVSGDTGCFAGCPHGYFSDEGVASVNAAIATLDDGLCDGYEAECGPNFALPCIGNPPPKCTGGQCVFDESNAGECDSCLSTTISWRITGPGTLPALPSPDTLELTGCNDITRRTPSGESCTQTIPQCPVPSGGPTVESLLTVLANEEVSAAFAAGGTHGQVEETSGFVYEITVGDDTIVYRTCDGTDDLPACTPPGALEDLRVLLDGLSSRHTCGTGGAPQCSSDFEAGTCDAIFNVWWHDPATGACVPMTYGGCDGNDNRYESLEACQAACPPPAAQNECASDRELSSTCYECGLGGGCATEYPVCAKQCANDADCEGEHAPLGSPSICDDTTKLCIAPGFCI